MAYTTNLLALAFLGLLFPQLVKPISCTDYTTESSCQATTNCYWDDYCLCNATSDLQVIFAMDSSGSVGSTDWETEEDFVIDMIDTGITEDSIVGIVQFASNGWKRHRFTDNQDKNYVMNRVRDLSYTKGATYILAAVEDANDIYEQFTNGNDRLLMIITDGNPNPNPEEDPCASHSDARNAREKLLDDLDVEVVIVGIGSSWDESTLTCLVPDADTHIITVDDFDDLSSIRGATDSFLCPSSISVKMTELRIDAGFTGGDAQWVELKNIGDPWDFSGNPMILEGYVQGSLDSGFLDVGQYMVLTNVDSTNDHNCSKCTCGSGTLLSNGECSNALYVDCYSGGDCFFSGSATNINWNQRVKDTIDGNTFVDETYSASTWPDINTGWCYELKEASGSWGQSCTSYGTPGDGELEPCDVTCYPSNCQGAGDDGATCSSNECVCSLDEYYYPDGSTCRYLPPPDNCKMTIKKQAENDYYQLTDWEFAVVPYDHNYEVEYHENGEDLTGQTVAGSNSFTYFDNADTINDPAPRVRTRLVLDSVTYYSEWANCDVFTSDPTPSPTTSPTFVPPSVTCTASVEGGTLDTYTVDWLEASFSYPNTPSSASFYRVYYYVDGSLYVTADVPYEADGDYTLTKLLGAAITDPFGQVVIKLNAELPDEDQMESEAVECPLSSASPTINPTNNPTPSPQPGQTNYPSSSPTQRPTYDPYAITSCTVTLQEGSTTDIQVDYVIDDSLQHGDPDLFLQVRMAVDFDFSFPTVLDSNPSILSEADAATKRYYVYPYYSVYEGGEKTEGVGQNCTLVSSAPTYSPSDDPSPSPTRRPTGIPSGAPTGQPSRAPTRAPTYADVVVTPCTYLLGKFDDDGDINTFRISFTEPTYTYPDTPEAADAKYVLTWASSTFSFGAIASGTNVQRDVDEQIAVADQLYLTVWTDYGTSDIALGDPTLCTPETLSPTPSPTDPLFTPSPTFSNPFIYFAGLGEECTESVCTDGVCTDPECTYDESGSLLEFTVRRNPGGFDIDVDFTWEIQFEDPRDAYDGGAEPADEDDFNEVSGSDTIDGDGDGTEDISFKAPKEDNDKNDDDDTEVAWLVLTGCRSDDNDDYPCSVAVNDDGDTPAVIRLLINDKKQDKLVINNVGDLPTWIWYPIAAGLVLLPLLAFFGYRYYKRRKFAEEMLKQREDELDELDGMGDLDNFNEVGDDVRFNPLATAGTHDIASGGEFIDQQLDAQKKNFEVAQVDVDNQVFRQDFGPVKAQARNKN